MPGSATESSDYRKRIWNKDRKPWDGEVGTVEVLRRAMWKSVYGLADRRRRGYTAVEVRSASLLVALEVMNHGSAEDSVIPTIRSGSRSMLTSYSRVGLK